MQLYNAYMQLWKEGNVCAGFSPRLPDYAIRYWLDHLQNAITLAKPRSFLDIGAGDGRLSLLLLRTGCNQGAAIEVQPNKHAWEPILNHYGRFELHEGLLQELTPQFNTQHKTFDFILLAEVFEHIPPSDVPAFLQHLYSVLTKNGTIFLTTPNFTALGPAEKSPQWHERQPWGHHKHYAFGELKTLLAAHGFKVQWHGFECHKIKSIVYNRWFYPISRLDARLIGSRKLPAAIRLAYRALSGPLMLLAKGCFWALAQLVYAIEKRKSNERTAGTMMMMIKKV